MPAVEKVSYTTIKKTKKLLAIIAQNVPLVPNVNKLGQALETTRDSCLKILYTPVRDKLSMKIVLTALIFLHIPAVPPAYSQKSNMQ